MVAEAARASADAGSALRPFWISELRRDSGCCRSLNWRCDLEPGAVDADKVETVFVEHGYASRCRHPALKVFRHPAGHELAWVVTTGRLQLRVAMAVEEAVRESAAKQLYQELIEHLQTAPDSPS